jgi:hypothetical protein
MAADGFKYFGAVADISQGFMRQVHFLRCKLLGF